MPEDAKGEGTRDRDGELLALLPFYASGAFGPADRARIEALLARSTAARAELAWLRALRRDVRADDPALPGDAGLGRHMRRVAVERKTARVEVVARPRPGRPQWLAPAVALAATLVLVQAVVIGWLASNEPGSGTLLQVTFKPDASEREIRAALAAAGAELVGGPGALGVYTVRVAGGVSETAKAALERSANVVTSVSILKR